MANANYSALNHDQELSDLHPDSDHGPSIVRNEKSSNDSVLRCWAWEILMAALAFSAFASLVIVLAVEDGTPSQRFGPLTLNAIDTVLTTVIVSAMMAFTGAALSQSSWNYFAQYRQQLSGRNNNTARPLGYLKLFDEASRGPEGSLRLLLRWRPLLVPDPNHCSLRSVH